jgi:branched-chain amino acid transport system substrate-binding protein
MKRMTKKLIWIAAALFGAAVCTSQNACASKPKLKIAFVAAFTGSDPNTARELKRGLNSFLASNPSAKEAFEIERFDNKGSVLGTVETMREIHQKGIDVVVGIARSDEALAAAKEAATSKTLFITPFATNASISQQGDRIFQTCFTDALQGEALSKLVANDLKPKSIVILTNSESVYSVGLSAAFTASLEKSGFRKKMSVQTISYTEKGLNADSLALQAAAFNPDVVFIPDHITRASLLAKAISKTHPKVKFLGGDGFGGKKILSGIFGDSPNIELFYSTHWHQSLAGKTNRDFINAYKKITTNEEPTAGAALTYDSMKIIWDVQAKNASLFDAASLSDRIRKGVFELTTGKLSFQKVSEAPTHKSAIIMHLKNGEYRVFKSISP